MLCHLCNQEDDLVKLKRCSHQFCKKCLYYYIKNNFAVKIKCPNELCNKNVQDRDIRQFLSNSDEYKYDKLCKGSIAKKCMTKICTFVFIVEGNDLNFTCPECFQPNCYKCNARHLPTDCGQDKLISEQERDIAAKLVLENRRIIQLHNYDETHDLIPPHEGFECPICCEFILPKAGVMLRCCCSYCKSCLDDAFKELQYINQLNCYECGTELAEIEKKAVIGSDKLRILSAGAIRKLLWHCKNADCEETWYTNKTTGFIICPRCIKANCLSCQNVHENKTCAQFRVTKEYLQLEASKVKAKDLAKVECYKCKEFLIQGGGCNALPCPACNVHTCLFKGIKAGVGGCGCTSKVPCDPKCLYGCNPDLQ